MKKTLLMILVLSLVFTINVFANLNVQEDLDQNDQDVINYLDQSNLSSRNNGKVLTRTAEYTEYIITNPKIIKRELEKDNIVVPKGKTVKSITTVVPNMDRSDNDSMSFEKSTTDMAQSAGLFSTYVVKNVSDLGSLWYFPSRVLHVTSGGPGGTISQEVSEGISAEFSCSVGVEAEVVSAEVGFSVTKEFSISDSYEKDLDANQEGMIKSWTYYNKKSFEVWKNPLIGSDEYLTTGYAYRPTGVRFRYFDM